MISLLPTAVLVVAVFTLLTGVSVKRPSTCATGNQYCGWELMQDFSTSLLSF